MERTIRVMLVDDHPPFRIGMRVLLEQNPAIGVVAEADTGRAALEQLADSQPTVVVLDCQLPDSDGPTVAKAIQQRMPAIRILALSAYDDLHYIRGLLGAGALGYLLKNEAPETIVAAVQAVAAGRSYFGATVAAQFAKLARGDDLQLEAPTAREHEVLQQLAKGLTNAQIAHVLGIAERTVRFHIENLFSRLQVDNRVEAVLKAMRLGWIEDK